MFEQMIIHSSEDEISNVKAITETTIVYNNQGKELKFLDVNTLKTNIIIKISRENETPLFCFSQDKRKLAYVNANSLIILDTRLQEKKRVKRLNEIKFSSPVTAISFDLSARYIFIGTEDNIVYQYRYNSDVLLYKYELFDCFKKRTKGITAIEFHKSIMAVSGNRGDMFVVDIYTKISKKIFIDESTTINDIKFIDKHTAITAHENGDTRITNIEKFNDYKKLDIPFTKIKQMLFLQNREYMLVCGDTEYITLINVKKHKNIRLRYLSFESEVKSITLVSQYVLVVLLVDNTLIRVNLPSPKQLESLILHGAFDEAYKLVEKEPQLLYSPEYKKLESTYETILDRVAGAIPMGNKEYAKQTVAFFKDVDVKRKEIELVLEAFDRYEQFQNLVYQKEYIPAYSYVERYPILKKTKEYKYMELQFKEQLSQAQEFLINGDTERANIHLNTYMRVKSKSGIVKLFLKHGETFLPYLELLRKRDVKRLQEAVRVNREFAKYVESLGISLHNSNKTSQNVKEIKDLIYKEEFIRAAQGIEDLKEELDVASLSELQTELEDTKKLYRLYKEKNFAECYNIIDTHETVKNTKLTKLLNAYWVKLMLKTESFYIVKDFANIEKILTKYKSLRYRHISLTETIFNSAPIMNPFFKAREKESV